jgi:hypothetical protein
MQMHIPFVHAPLITTQTSYLSHHILASTPYKKHSSMGCIACHSVITSTTETKYNNYQSRQGKTHYLLRLIMQEEQFPHIASKSPFLSGLPSSNAPNLLLMLHPPQQSTALHQ